MSTEELDAILAGKLSVEWFHTFHDKVTLIILLDGSEIEFCLI